MHALLAQHQFLQGLLSNFAQTRSFFATGLHLVLILNSNYFLLLNFTVKKSYPVILYDSGSKIHSSVVGWDASLVRIEPKDWPSLSFPRRFVFLGN
uniref:Uncharacterized protein n=1 Tax=Cannabis sativa TaxID=3483 RepID=A0A803NMX7_CANSA